MNSWTNAIINVIAGVPLRGFCCPSASSTLQTSYIELQVIKGEIVVVHIKQLNDNLSQSRMGRKGNQQLHNIC